MAVAAEAGAGMTDSALSHVDQLRERHLAMARALAGQGDVATLSTHVSDQFDQLAAVVKALGVLREVSFNALHVLGSLGTTDLTPIQAMYSAAPTMGIADGVDEVHIATVARRLLRDYRPHEGNFPTEFLPYKREAAKQKMQPLLNARPDLAAAAEAYQKYFARHR